MNAKGVGRCLLCICLLLVCCKEVDGSADDYDTLRCNMVERQIIARGVQNPAVLQAMQEVPRQHFVPENVQNMAYADMPLPIGEGQTISQPYIVAYMSEAIAPKKDDVVLEIGTGSGYQAAVLARMVKQVYSLEIICPLAEKAAQTLAQLGYSNVQVKCGDGYQGWPENAPFDAIIVTAAPEKIPARLKEQLKIGGRMIVPVGRLAVYQELILLTRTAKDSWTEERLLPVRFVPMTGNEGTVAK